MKESSEQTLSTEVMQGMDPSEARLPLDSLLASPLINVSFFCKSRIYSVCNISQRIYLNEDIGEIISIVWGDDKKMWTGFCQIQLYLNTT